MFAIVDQLFRTYPPAFCVVRAIANAVGREMHGDESSRGVGGTTASTGFTAMDVVRVVLRALPGVLGRWGLRRGFFRCSCAQLLSGSERDRPGRVRGERGGIVLVGDAVGQIDYVLVPVGGTVEIRQRECRVGCRGRVSDCPDRGGEVVGALVQFGGGEDEDVVADAQGSCDAVDYFYRPPAFREIPLHEQISGQVDVLGDDPCEK